MDFSGIAALVTAITSAFIGIGSYIRGQRHNKAKGGDDTKDDAGDGSGDSDDLSGAFTALERYHEIFEDFEVDRARLRRELDETREERDHYKRRLAKYEAVENDHDDDSPSAPIADTGPGTTADST